MEYAELSEFEIDLPKSEVAVLMEIPEGETLESEDLMKCLLGSGWKISESQISDAVESLASKGLLEYDD